MNDNKFERVGAKNIAVNMFLGACALTVATVLPYSIGVWFPIRPHPESYSFFNVFFPWFTGIIWMCGAATVVFVLVCFYNIGKKLRSLL